MSRSCKKLINIKNVSLKIGNRYFFDKLSLSINTGDRLAVIGEEGNGKTMLLKLLVGFFDNEVFDTTGQIERLGKIGYLSQDLVDVSGKNLSVREFLVFDEKKEKLNWDKFNDWRLIEKQANEMNIEDLLERDVKYKFLSGGEKVKINLLKLILDEPDILILDEPTNSMDLNSRVWLESFLIGFDGAIVFVSHDEMFLECMANRILCLEQVSGGKQSRWIMDNIDYKSFVKNKKQEYERKLNKYYRESRRKRKYLDLVTDMKNRVRQSQENIKDCNARRLLNKKMKSVVVVEKRLKSRFNLEKPKREKIDSFSISDNVRVGDLELLIENVRCGDREILKKYNLKIGKGEKVFIVGKNGIGKTILLSKIFAILRKRNIKSGYFEQEIGEKYTKDMKLIDIFGDNFEKFDLMGRLSLLENEIQLKWGDLSEGQKTKIELIRLLSLDCGLLLLDEPFRNLSIFTKDQFIKSIKDSTKSMLIVSHDREVINKLADRVLVFNDEIKEKFRNEKNLFFDKI